MNDAEKELEESKSEVLPGQADIFSFLQSTHVPEVIAEPEAMSCLELPTEGELELLQIQDKAGCAGAEKQTTFLMEVETDDSKYTHRIESPIYRPRTTKPHILLLCDKSKTKSLIAEIDASPLDDDEKDFLRAAAWRHAVFHYERIADYYANATDEMKRLMEQSALVIIDFNSAIEKGFIKVCEEIRSQYFQEYTSVGIEENEERAS